ncbi:MAG: sulfotransferase [Phycisphaerales bacterium]|nr:sulfotransferase [Phycisphaerales bacterium]
MTLAAETFARWQAESRLLDRLHLVFVVGPPKCGTTWVQKTLGSHPRCRASGEAHLATRLAPALSQGVRWYTQQQDGQSRQAGHRTSTWITPLDEACLLRQAMDRVLIGYLRSTPPDKLHGLTHLADKTPGHARQVPLLADLYPSARFVCVVRDVRDAAVSAWHHFSRIGLNILGPGPLEAAAEVYARDHWAELLRHCRAAGAALGPARYTEVHYEHYKRDPEGTAGALFAFCGLACDEATVRECVRRNDFQAITGRPAGEEAPDFHRKGIVGDWRNHFSEAAGQHLLDVARERLNLGTGAPGSAASAAVSAPAL